uniref:RWP-RK domain-containing protein n=1 Tax=Hemiselmis andersenii TaxID=464988 RepID=A0A7S0UDB4_HEMAN
MPPSGHPRRSRQPSRLSSDSASPAGAAAASGQFPQGQGVPGGYSYHVEMIMPRNKPGETGVKDPVAITLPILCQYFHEPLSVASAQIGISSTALKRVCRKLGVRRWPFTPDRSGKKKTGKGESSGDDDSETIDASPELTLPDDAPKNAPPSEPSEPVDQKRARTAQRPHPASFPQVPPMAAQHQAHPGHQLQMHQAAALGVRAPILWGNWGAMAMGGVFPPQAHPHQHPAIIPSSTPMGSQMDYAARQHRINHPHEQQPLPPAPAKAAAWGGGT